MMHYIMSDETVYAKMMTEIDEATRRGHLSSMPQYSEVLEHCPYYIACVKETMRLCPSAPNIFPRMSPEGGLVLNGQFIPGGVEVTCNPWLVHRDEAIYGSDANEFKPERWLDEEKAKVHDKYSMVFGYGVRSCLGKDIALMELYKAPLQVGAHRVLCCIFHSSIVLQFFRNFRPEMSQEGRRGEFMVKGGVGFWKEMWMRLERRAPIM